MKKCILLLIALCLLLTGCGTGKNTANWQPDWVEVAPFLAVSPVECYEFGESADTFGLGGVYYATWTNGDPRNYTNADGEETVIFNSQIYVIVQEFRSESEARTALNQWLARESQNYSCGEATAVTVDGRDYTLLPLFSGSETNPYGFGCAAFAIHGTNAICVELVCSDTFTAEPQSVLEQFLNNLHYSE